MSSADAYLSNHFNIVSMNCINKPLACKKALGMENDAISDGQITASSKHAVNHEAYLAKLYLKGNRNRAGGWIGGAGDANPWLQIDRGQHFNITRVATQGRNGCCPQWTAKYNLQYSDDGVTFRYYKNEQRQTKVPRQYPLIELTIMFKGDASRYVAKSAQTKTMELVSNSNYIVRSRLVSICFS